MIPWLTGQAGNPSSLHGPGRKSAQALDEAREAVASLIGAEREEIIFTSCGTEANNFAVRGLAAAHAQKGKHLVISSTEHFSVLYAARRLEKEGYQVTLLPVDRYGWVNPDELRKAIRPETVLVSVMHANGEVGTIQPIEEIAKITKEQNVLFHTDAISACGTIPVDVKRLGVDAMTLAADQFYGPVGAAALYLRKGVKIFPFLDGGGQEEGLRSGTENLPAIVGMGKAAELAREKMEKRNRHIIRLRDKLIQGLLSVEGVSLNGHPTRRLPGHVSVSVPDIEGESLLLALDLKGVSVGLGSACNSKALKSSHVLRAMGIPDRQALGTLVLTVGLDTEEADIDYVLKVFPEAVSTLREFSLQTATNK